MNKKILYFTVCFLVSGIIFACAQEPKKGQLCIHVAEALKNELNPLSQKFLFVDSTDTGGRTWTYKNIDLDLDGKFDELVQSCGSPSDGSCTLNVILSRGNAYEFSEKFFKLINFQEKYYVVVGDSYPPDQRGNRNLYQLTDRTANLVCNSF